MTEESDRTFSRLYAQLRRQADGDAGDDGPEEREALDPLGFPKVANPKRRSKS